jgi:hypothetical protein
MGPLVEPTSSPVVRERQALQTILIAWMLAGTLDIATAVLYYAGLSITRATTLLQGIASGVLGATAFAGGLETAAFGLVLHYLITLIWTLVLFVCLEVFKALTRHLALTGIVYGIVIWLTMNLIVLPLSKVRHAPIHLRPAIIAATILVFCIGLPIALVVGVQMRRDKRDA